MQTSPRSGLVTGTVQRSSSTPDAATSSAKASHGECAGNVLPSVSLHSAGTVTSPMLRVLPATPENTMPVTSKWSSSVRVVFSAFTSPTPVIATTTGTPASTPRRKIWSSIVTVSSMVAASTRGASSAGNALNTAIVCCGGGAPSSSQPQAARQTASAPISTAPNNDSACPLKRTDPPYRLAANHASELRRSFGFADQCRVHRPQAAGVESPWTWTTLDTSSDSASTGGQR